MNNNLVFGKSGYKDIVGLEVSSGQMEIFTQQEDGSVVSRVEPIKHWILSNEQISKGARRLEGDLHYKWGQGFDSLDQWRKMRAIWGKMNMDIYSIWNQEEAACIRYGISFFQGLKHNEVSILSFDIETNGITLDSDSQTILISNTFRNNKNEITRKLFCYNDYQTQQHMIDEWCIWIKQMNPSILVGHNCIGFDLKYLDHCSRDGLSLGRDESVLKFENYESKFRKDGTQFITYNKPKCYGRTIADTMFLAMKYDISRKYENYKLKSIIAQEGLEKQNRVFYDASQIRLKYKDPEELKKIITYCIDDSDDALALYDLMAPSQFYWAQNVPKTYQEILLGATGSQINSFLLRAYLQDNHSIPKATETTHFSGAISYGNPGIYNNTIRWDVSSLYPSVMIAFEVYDESKDPKGYFLEMVKTFTKERLNNKKLAKETKNKYYDDIQGSQKIAINSAYGFMGAPGLNFNCIEGAAFVTEKGREILTKAIEWATGKDEKSILHLLDNKS